MVDKLKPVGVAEMEVCDNSTVLASFGLGSCVAVAIYDPHKEIGGLAHVMLPESKAGREELAPGKFADTAVERLVGELVLRGANKRRLVSKIAGGAQMFEIPGLRHESSFVGTRKEFTIGERNVRAVKEALERQKVCLLAEDTGGHHGRTVKFNTSTGEMEIISIQNGKVVI